MNEYQEFTKEFVEKLRKNEICQEYFRQKELVIAQYPDLKRQIDDFREKNFRLQNETDSDRLFDEIDRFEREYEEFRKNPIVNDFLAAELAFCRLFQEIQAAIGEAFAADFDLSN